MVFHCFLKVRPCKYDQKAKVISSKTRLKFKLCFGNASEQVWGLPNRPETRPGTLPNPSRTLPRWPKPLQDTPNAPPRWPKPLQDTPNATQDGSKTTPRHPKTAPRGPIKVPTSIFDRFEGDLKGFGT